MKAEMKKEWRNWERKKREGGRAPSSLFPPPSLFPFLAFPHMRPLFTVHHVAGSQLLAVPLAMPQQRSLFGNPRKWLLSIVQLRLCPLAGRDVPLFGLPSIRAL